MLVVDVISRFAHIITAITLLGGSIFTLLVLVPALESTDSEARSKWMDAVRGKWKRFVHAGIALFLITGFYNYFKAMPAHKGDGLYHALVNKDHSSTGTFFRSLGASWPQRCF